MDPDAIARTAEGTLKEHGFILQSLIGKGGFSCVYQIYSEKYNYQSFVAKVVPLASSGDVKLVDKEAGALIMLDHPNIIKIFDYFSDSHCFYLIFEYCSRGSMKKYVDSNFVWNIEELVLNTIQILKALQHCHQSGIAHRDIKPQNILIDEYGRPKLADFGLSSLNPSSNEYGAIGTKPYMAPELLLHQKYDPFKADIWSLGVTFYAIAYGTKPWPKSATARNLEVSITNGIVNYPSRLHPSYIQFLKGMINVKPSKRKSIDQLLNILQENFRKKKITSHKINTYSSLDFHAKDMRSVGKLLISNSKSSFFQNSQNTGLAGSKTSRSTFQLNDPTSDAAFDGCQSNQEAPVENVTDDNVNHTAKLNQSCSTNNMEVLNNMKNSQSSGSLLLDNKFNNISPLSEGVRSCNTFYGLQKSNANVNNKHNCASTEEEIQFPMSLAIQSYNCVSYSHIMIRRSTKRRKANFDLGMIKNE